MAELHWKQTWNGALVWSQTWGGAPFDLGALSGSLSLVVTASSFSYLPITPDTFFEIELPLEGDLVPALTAAVTLTYPLAGALALGVLSAQLSPVLSSTVTQLEGIVLFTIPAMPSLSPQLTVAASIVSRVDWPLGFLSPQLSPVLTAVGTVHSTLLIPFDLGVLAVELAPELSMDMNFDITQRLEWATLDSPVTDDWLHQSELIS